MDTLMWNFICNVIVWPVKDANCSIIQPYHVDNIDCDDRLLKNEILFWDHVFLVVLVGFVCVICTLLCCLRLECVSWWCCEAGLSFCLRKSLVRNVFVRPTWWSHHEMHQKQLLNRVGMKWKNIQKDQKNKFKYIYKRQPIIYIRTYICQWGNCKGGMGLLCIQ